jgi:LAS superfamily LD-carboxypeptidase LdcB
MAKENMGDTFGILNPCHEKKTIGPSLDPAKVETKDLLQRTVLELFNKNAVSGQGKLKGILLEKPKQTLNSLCSWAKITKLSDVEKSITGAKVRIPEIHASYPNPCSYGDADHADSGIIALYPTFYFESEEVQRRLQSELKPGDLVWVDFEDRTNLKNGVITGMVKGGSGVQELCDKIGKMHNNKTAGRQTDFPEDACYGLSNSQRKQEASYKDGKCIGIKEMSNIPTRLGQKHQKMEKSAATAFIRMSNAAASADVIITAENGWRSWSHQNRLRNENCKNPKDGNTCKPGTATPGHSNHQQGLSVDIHGLGPNATKLKPDRAEKMWVWLNSNAASYNFKNDVKGERWHWTYYGPRSVGATGGWE